MNAQLRRPANSLESGENLDTFHRKHKKSSLRSGIEKKVKPSEGGKSHKLSWSTGTEHNPWESSPSQEGGRWESSHSQRDNFHTWGFQPPQRESSEEVDRRTSGARVRHDEKKKYSTKITATGDHQSTEVVEGELFPIQLQGGPVYKRTGEVESFNQNGAVGTSVPEIRANMFLADQNGNMHKIRDNMVSTYM